MQRRIEVAKQKRCDEGLPVRKQRKDAVHAVEIILSASPEYFRPENPRAAGKWRADRLKAWQDLSFSWLGDKYGDRLIDARLHLDEATPHIQAIVVPITPDNRLSTKELFSGKREMAALQTEYGKVVEPLGIMRGRPGSTAKHTRITQFYRAAMSEPPPAPAIETPPIWGREKWAQDKGWTVRSAFETAAAPSRLALIERTNLVKAVAAAEMMAQAVKAEAGVRVEAATKERDAERAAKQRAQEEARAARGALKNQREDIAAQMRDLDLAQVLEAAGWDANPHDKAQWLGPGGGRISLSGVEWHDHTAGKGGGKAIDLAIHLTGLAFKEAVEWLADRFGVRATQAALRARAEEPIEKARPFVPPPEAPALLDQMKFYLAGVRKLGTPVMDQLHKIGRLFANAVFPMRPLDDTRRIVGAELLGTGPEPFQGLAPGSSRNAGGFWFETAALSKSAPRTFLLTDSAIDAVSLFRLREREKSTAPREIYASLAGARSRAPWITSMLKPDDQLVIAFAADAVGDEAAEEFILDCMRGGRSIPERLRPPEGIKDWNELLQLSENDPARYVAVMNLSTPTARPSTPDDDAPRGPSL